MLDLSEEISHDDFQKLTQLKEDLAQKHCSSYWNTKYNQGKLDQNKVKQTLTTLNQYLIYHAQKLGVEYTDNFIPEQNDYLKAKFQHKLNLLENNTKLDYYQELGEVVFDKRANVNQRLEKISSLFDQLGNLSDQELEIISALKQKMEQKWKSRPQAQYLLDKIQEETSYNQVSNNLRKTLPFPVEPEDIKNIIQSVQDAKQEAQEKIKSRRELLGENYTGDPSATLHTTVYSKLKENSFVKNLKEKLDITLGSVCTKFVKMLEKASSSSLELNYA
jgi:hypothetical protein